MVFDNERDFGHSQGFALAGTGEDYVFHAATAEGAGALFAEDPADRLDYIGFAAAIGANDRRNAWIEGNDDFLRKGLEAKNFELSETHNPAPAGHSTKSAPMGI